MAMTPEGPQIAAFLNSFAEGVVLTDAALRLSWMNRAAEYLLGISRREWLGRPASALAEAREELQWIFEEESVRPRLCWEILRCENRDCPLLGKTYVDCWARKGHPEREDGDAHGTPKNQCSHCRVYNSHVTLREKEVNRKGSSQTMVLQVQSTPLCDEQGALLGKIRLIRDLTCDKQLGELKDQFLAALVHELRSPLTSIRSYTEILLRYTDTEPETQREFLWIIHGEGERLDQMIEDMVEVQALDRARSVWHNKEIYIPEMIQRVLLDYRRTLEKKKIGTKMELDPQAPTVWTDPDKIYHVIFTLVKNLAGKTPEGGTLLIKAYPLKGQRKTDTTPLMRFSVSSLPPPSGGPAGAADASGETAQSQTVTQRKKGLGLGFTLCKTILDQYGGNLWLEEGENPSQVTYHFTMPASVPASGGFLKEKPKLEFVPAVGSQPAIDKSKVRILIVDDDPSSLNPITIILQKEGYRVHPTTNVRRALEMVQEAKPDLIISDIKMPEIDGYAFFQQIQENESTKAIPFIFISGLGEKEARVRGFKTGVDDYLAKPIDPGDLIDRVEAVLLRVERYKDLSRLDSLTGALTRKTFEEQLDWEILKARRENTGFCLVMADLDHFKKVNDTHGHLVGDFVLHSFVAFLQNNLREEDVVARYGGEEFCIIMPVVERSTAGEILERIRKQLSETSFNYEKEDLPITVTCSFGVSGFPNDGVTAARLIEKSDAALYQAKRTGRNRVVLFG
jgi:diguanylate cyclase (GGDEF)-like protein